MVYYRLEGARHLMVKDIGDPLAWCRDGQQRWGAGLYLDHGEPDNPISYRYTYDSSIAGLVELVHQALTERPDQR